MKEVIRTTGDIRRFIAQAMSEIRSGEMSIDKGMCIAALSKEMSSSMQVEVNVAKVRVSMLGTSNSLGKVTHLGRLIIEDEEGSTPTLDGRA